MLPVAIALISLALASYTTGVWAERRSGRLQTWHAVAFGIGLVFDAAGTLMMSAIADSPEAVQFATSPVAQALNATMAVTGALAIALMAVHLGWAIVVLVRNRESEKLVFHKFSVTVWAIWLVPYVTGMAAAMLT